MEKGIIINLICVKKNILLQRFVCFKNDKMRSKDGCENGS